MVVRWLRGARSSAYRLRRMLSVTAAWLEMGRLRLLLALNHVVLRPHSFEKSYCVSTNPSCLQDWKSVSRKRVLVLFMSIFSNEIYFSTDFLAVAK